MSCILGWLNTEANMQICFLINGVLDSLGYTLNNLFHPHPNTRTAFFCKQSLEQIFQNSQGPRDSRRCIPRIWFSTSKPPKYIDSVLKLWVINFLWFCLHKYAPKSFITNQHTHKKLKHQFVFPLFRCICSINPVETMTKQSMSQFPSYPRSSAVHSTVVCIVYSGTVWTISL